MKPTIIAASIAAAYGYQRPFRHAAHWVSYWKYDPRIVRAIAYERLKVHK